MSDRQFYQLTSLYDDHGIYVGQMLVRVYPPEGSVIPLEACGSASPLRDAVNRLRRRRLIEMDIIDVNAKPNGG